MEQINYSTTPSVGEYAMSDYNNAKHTTRSKYTDLKEDPSLKPLYEEQKKEINLQQIKKCLLGTSFYYLIACLVFAGLLAFCLTWGYPFFWFMTEAYLPVLATLIFAVLILSHHKVWNGFFMILGFGYGYVSIIRLIQLQNNKWTDTGIFPDDDREQDKLNYGSQLRSISTFLEVISFLIGLLLAKKNFKGPIVPIIVFFAGLLYFFLCISSIFWWNSFPNIYQADGDRTGFGKSLLYILPIGFGIVFIGIIIQRHAFDIDTFLFLVIALFFRTLSTAIGSIGSDDYSPNGGSITVHLFRDLGFAYLFCAVGITTLRNPTKTLFRNLKQHKKVLQYEKTFTEWMINQVPAIVVLLNQDGMVTHTNTVTSNMFKIDNASVLGKSFEETFISNDGSNKEFSLNTLLEKSHHGAVTDSTVYEATHPTNGRIIEWRFTSFNITRVAEENSRSSAGEGDIKENKIKQAPSEEDRIVVLCLGQDITEKREREEKITQAKNEAQQASEMKDTFVANVSHELRTPLNCIVGVTSLMESSNELNESQSEMLRMISGAAGVLLDLINDLLDVNSIRQGTMHLYYASFELRKFIEEVIYNVNLHPTLVEKVDIELAFRIHHNCPVDLYLDKKRLRQVIVNLLSNAIKFTNRGQIILSVKVKQNVESGEAPYILFSVKDSGVGIKEEDLAKLFRRFSQVDGANTRRYTGTGIGLHISKQLVEMMSGEINVTSKEGVGSKFYFKVPLVSQENSSPRLLIRKIPEVISSQDQKVIISFPDQKIANLILKVLKVDQGMSGVTLAPAEQLDSQIRVVSESNNLRPEKLAVLVESVNFQEVNVETLKKFQSSKILVVVVISRKSAPPTNPHLQLLKDAGYLVKIMNKPVQHSALIEMLNGDYEFPKEEKSTEDEDKHDDITKSGDSSEKSVEEFPRKHILVAEDNLVNQKVLKMLFSKVGSNITYEIANNGQEAVDMFKKSGPFDLILMDCQMPIMDGFKATMLIRQYEIEQKLSRVTILAFSANAMEREKKEFIEAGMDGYIVKPVNLKTLKEKIFDETPTMD